MLSRLLMAAAAVLLVGSAYQALAAGPTDKHGVAEPGKLVITMLAVEPKGGVTVDKEAFPTAPLPEGDGYVLKEPDSNGRWEVSAYVFMPSQVIVNEGDEVTLDVVGINGAEHPSIIEGYDVEFTAKRGQLTRVTFVADKPGVYRIICGTHQPSMHAELIVLPKS